MVDLMEMMKVARMVPLRVAMKVVQTAQMMARMLVDLMEMMKVAQMVPLRVAMKVVQMA